MPVSRGVQSFSRALLVVLVLAIFSLGAFAQSDAQGNSTAPAKTATVSTPTNNPPNGPTPQIDYSKGRSMLSIYGPYVGRNVPEADFKNSARLDSAIQNGNIYLSLDQAIALALENNYDIAIARYNLNIADTDILRTKAGGFVRGVNTGVISGTPGGSTSASVGAQGGGAGGTSTGTGGAGAGASGIVSSTLGSVGSALDSFDPVLTGGLQIEHATSPQASPFAGSSTLSSNTGTANFGYQQGWGTGTLMGLSFNNSHQTTNSIFTTYSPLLNSSFRFTMRQHLLQGWGYDNNHRQIYIARNDRKISDIAFQLQVMTTVSQIQNIYWDLVSAYQDLKVKQRALEFANRTLSDNKKQVEIGTLAPIEVVSAQSAVASAQQAMIVSETNLQYQQLLMKNAISRNFTDPLIANTPVIPTDAMSLTDETAAPNVEDLVSQALRDRPELKQSAINLQNQQISKKAARNALLPTLDIVGFYGASALGGAANPLSICPNGTSFCVPAGTVPSVGYGDTFSNLFNSSAPDKGVALSLTIPIRNRAAQADQIRSELEYRQAQLQFQQQKNQVSLQVRNASFSLQQSRAAVEAAKAARDFAQQNLDAEQKKYALGASTSYLVLQQLSNLTKADSDYVAALASYEKARVALDQVTAKTLDRNGIIMQDAVSGQVVHEPAIPNVGKRDQDSLQYMEQNSKPQANPAAPQPPQK